MPTTQQRATAARNISYAARPDGDTKRIPILPGPSGFIGRDGRRYFYDIEQLNASILANAADVPVFVDHQPGRAVGWSPCAPLIPVGDGYEAEVKYTAEGEELLRSNAYRYDSPTYWVVARPTADGSPAMDFDIVGLMEVSLTNLPNLRMRALNSVSPEGLVYTVETAPSTDDAMTKELLAALGLAEDAALDAAVAAINALREGADRATAITTAAGVEATADATAVVEAVANSRITSGALVAKNVYDEAVTRATTAENALATLRAETQTAAVEAALNAACTGASAVMTPAQAEKLRSFATADLAGFKAFVATLKTHPAAAPNALATRDVKDETFGLSAAELQICKTQDIPPAIFAKNLRKQ
jgi:hypothetical protein